MEMIIIVQIINLLFIVLYVTVIILVIRALLKYLRTKEASNALQNDARVCCRINWRQ